MVITAQPLVEHFYSVILAVNAPEWRGPYTGVAFAAIDKLVEVGWYKGK